MATFKTVILSTSQMTAGNFARLIFLRDIFTRHTKINKDNKGKQQRTKIQNKRRHKQKYFVNFTTIIVLSLLLRETFSFSEQIQCDA